MVSADYSHERRISWRVGESARGEALLVGEEMR